MKHNKQVTNRKPESKEEGAQQAAMEKKIANPASEPSVPGVLKTEGGNEESDKEFVSSSGPDSGQMNAAQSKKDKKAKNKKDKNKTGKEQKEHDPARAAFE